MHLIYLGRRHRVVGATYYTDYRHSVYFTPEKLDENIQRWMTIYSETLK